MVGRLRILHAHAVFPSRNPNSPDQQNLVTTHRKASQDSQVNIHATKVDQAVLWTIFGQLSVIPFL